MAGRRNKYFSHVQPHLDDILQWKREGAKEETIAAKLGVSVSSFSLYKTQYTELLEVIKRGDAKIADIAEESLFNIIQGHFVEETKTIIEYNDGKQKKRVEKFEKWVEPNATGIIFTLKHKRPEVWHDSRHTIISGNLEVSNPFADLTVKELRALAAKDDDDE